MLFRAVILCVAFALAAGAAPQSVAAATRLSEARAAAGRGDWRLAEQASRAELQLRPNSEAAAVLHARALIHLAQPFDAALELEDFLARKPRSTAAGKLYAALLVDVVQDRNKAEEVLLRCAANSPRDAEVQEALGKLYLFRHRFEQAVERFRNAARLAPLNPLYPAELARAVEESGKPSEAEVLYRRAVALNRKSAKPNSAAYALYAEYLARNGRHSDAVPYYTQALLADPHNAAAYQGRGIAWEHLGDLRRAEADALAALRESGERKDSRQLLLRVYRASGDGENLRKQAEALEKLVTAEQAELSRGREMRAALNEAESLLGAGRFAEAVTAYERVVAANPEFYEAWFALGVSYGQTGQVEKAEAALRKYLGFQPLSADGHAALGLLLMTAQRNADAQPVLEEALKLDPEAAEVRKALAFALLDRREFDKAAAVLESIVRTQTAPDAETLALAAKALFGSGRKDEASQLCLAGLRAFPANPELEALHATFLADCSRQVSCRAQAIAALKQNPRSAAYLKAVTTMLIDTAPLDEATAHMVERTQAALPDDVEPAYLRSKWLLATNKPEEAAVESASVLRSAQGPLKARALTIAAVAADRLGKAEQAELSFAAAHAENRALPAPDPAVAVPYIDFLVRQSRDAEADRLVGEALRWNPAYGPLLVRRATFLANSGLLEDAVRVGETVVQQEEPDQDVLRAAHVLLARAYTALGRPEQAKPHLEWVTRGR